MRKRPSRFQIPDPEAVLLQAGAQLDCRVLLPAVELDEQPAPRLPDLEEGGVQPTQDVDVLGDGQHVVGDPQEGVQLPYERPRTFAALEEVLQGLAPDPPVLAELPLALYSPGCVEG
jgi:hypothetical protein